MTMSINGTSGLVFNDASTQNTAATGFGFKNRIINGAMVIDQRNAGASVTANDGVFGVDRFKYAMSQASKGTSQQSSTAPTGFTKSLLFTSSAATSLAAGDFYVVRQIIEGFNVADLAWGTAAAASVTLSFWARSSLTGTFGGAFQNAASSRFYAFSYTISAANTWEYKTVVIAGDTSGTWTTDNTAGLTTTFGLGVGTTYSGTAGSWGATGYLSATGAVSVVGTSGATFYITGVQLEKGSTATAFDYRPYGTELALCQRYFETTVSNTELAYSGYVVTGNGYYVSGAFCVDKRAAPTMAYTTGAVSGFSAGNPSGASVSVRAFRASTPNSSTTGGAVLYYGYTASAEL